MAAAFESVARQRKISLDIVRTGSRGLYWLEPMGEVATADGRIAYGPVATSDVDALLWGRMLTGAAHPLRLGAAEEIRSSGARYG